LLLLLVLLGRAAGLSVVFVRKWVGDKNKKGGKEEWGGIFYSNRLQMTRCGGVFCLVPQPRLAILSCGKFLPAEEP
jgi:hypothetical protein